MLLEAKDIRVSFRKENQTRLFGRERQEVLHGLSIDLKEGECLGIIGESGSGKSTFGRVLCGLLAPDSGTVRLDWLNLYGRLPRVDKARILFSISDAEHISDRIATAVLEIFSSGSAPPPICDSQASNTI